MATSSARAYGRLDVPDVELDAVRHRAEAVDQFRQGQRDDRHRGQESVRGEKEPWSSSGPRPT